MWGVGGGCGELGVGMGRRMGVGRCMGVGWWVWGVGVEVGLGEVSVGR